MDKIYLDTNILQDILTGRPNSADSLALFQLVQNGHFEAMTAAINIPTLFYTNRKSTSATSNIRWLLKTIHLTDTTAEIVHEALRMKYSADIEDGVQYVTALTALCAAFITKEESGFPSYPLVSKTPHLFLQSLR